MEIKRTEITTEGLSPVEKAATSMDSIQYDFTPAPESSADQAFLKTLDALLLNIPYSVARSEKTTVQNNQGGYKHYIVTIKFTGEGE
ncbi:hypothetical protein GOV06_03340 [Candidatus Woesearchaeota archaeon]|nr:hypothetical protein [Candidatus Woesearchaeota archaeon]